MDTDTKKGYSMIIKKIIIALCMFLGQYIPPFGEMTQFGMGILVIFIAAIVGWSIIDLMWPSLVGLIALYFVGAYDSFAAMLAAGFGSQTSWLILGALFICAILEKTNICPIIASFMLELKIAKKSPFLMAEFFFLAGFLASVATSSLITVLIFSKLYMSFASKANIAKDNKAHHFWFGGILFSCVAGGMSMPFKPSPVIVIAMYGSAMGENIDFITWTLGVAFGFVVLITLYVLFAKWILKVNLTMFDPKSLQLEKVKATKQEIAILWFLLIMLLLLCLPGLFPKSTFLPIVWLNALGSGGTMILLLILMSFWQVEGKPVVSLQMYADKFSWSVYIMVGFFSPLASFLSSDRAGLSTTLAGWLGSILGGLSPVLIVLACVFLAMILSNIMNNIIVCILISSILFPLTQALSSINMMALIMVTYLASNCAIALPSASPSAAIHFSANTEIVSTGAYTKYGWISGVLFSVLCVAWYFVCLLFC